MGIYKGMIGFSMWELAREMHARGHYDGQQHADQLVLVAPLLNVMGTETNWKHGGKWRPMADEELLYRRAMCKGKPFCF